MDEKEEKIEQKKVELKKLKGVANANKENIQAKLDYIICLLELGEMRHDPPDEPPPNISKPQS